MPVQNIECQLAQGQINRYLAGDTLSEAALQQLEAHVGECADCKAFLYEKRSSLFSILGHAAPESQPEPAPVEDPSPKAKSLISAIRAKKPAPQPEPSPAAIPTHAVIEVDSDVVPETPKVFAKPLLYSAGLALVLIFMSTVMRDPTRFLGASVNETLPSAAGKPATAAPTPTAKATPVLSAPAASNEQPTNPATQPATPETPATSQPATVNSEAQAQPEPKTPAPAAQPETTPAPSASTTASTPNTTSTTPAPQQPVRQPARTAQTRTTPRADRPRSNPRRSAPAASRPTQPPRPSGIRLYDANGNPINP